MKGKPHGTLVFVAESSLFLDNSDGFQKLVVDVTNADKAGKAPTPGAGKPISNFHGPGEITRRYCDRRRFGIEKKVFDLSALESLGNQRGPPFGKGAFRKDSGGFIPEIDIKRIFRMERREEEPSAEGTHDEDQKKDHGQDETLGGEKKFFR